jgi:sugar/nucleoside kinase (ribokinase family)
MTRRVDIVGIGLAVYDASLLVTTYPESNTKIDAIDYWHGGGGPVPNTLVALARWGVDTAFIGRVGDDRNGRALRDDFQRVGVDVTHFELDPELDTPFASIWVEADTGLRTAVLGSSHYAQPRQLPRGTIENARLLHCDARDPWLCREAALRARNSGVEVSLDVGSPRLEARSLVPLVDHLVVAKRFAEAATGKQAVSDMLTALHGEANGDVVITLGEEGAIGQDRGGSEARFGAYEVECVDTTGAGDIFHAGYLFGVLQGWSLSRRMTYAAAAAALATTALGARGCIPAAGDVEALARAGHTRR